MPRPSRASDAGDQASETISFRNDMGDVATDWKATQEWLRAQLEQHRLEMCLAIQECIARELRPPFSSPGHHLAAHHQVQVDHDHKAPLGGKSEEELVTTQDDQNSPQQLSEEGKSAEEAFEEQMDDLTREQIAEHQANLKKKQRKLTKILSQNHLAHHHSRLHKFVKGPLDWWIGVIVCSNVLIMVVQAEWMGITATKSLKGEGIANFEDGALADFFNTSEYVFWLIYLVDTLLRIILLRKEWFYDEEEGYQFANLFDASLVVASTFELLIVPILLTDSGSTGAIKILKLTRLSRAFRVIRTVKVFRQLKVLLTTCIASIGAFVWSFVLLLMLQMITALILCQSLFVFVIDESQDLDMRIWVDRHYGSFFKALYTMFEITYSGGWPGFARPLVEHVSVWYSAIMLVYVTLVIFAIIRIITALFLKETLSCAANDAELAMEEKRSAAARYKAKLEELFSAADLNGDGAICSAEFHEALSNPQMRQYLNVLELQVRDVSPLFDLLDDGDDKVTIEEFVEGISHLKGGARSLDVVMLKHEFTTTRKWLMDTMDSLQIAMSSSAYWAPAVRPKAFR
eukprot:TRINITY_DN94999_c0_g1_i1.p1 TRINITY_DN94999_c0_g1~~TRINITY_DN94999_c0_g1_i1.p1  ORF type:complete len:573 (+),score=124.25 TRINITY_DN94999_c0_g1_i1:35-1753(+)